MSEEAVSTEVSTEVSEDQDSSWEQPEENDDDLFDDVKEARAKAPKVIDKKDEAKKEPAPKAESKRFIKTVVNGKEVPVSEEELIREFQKSRAGDEKLAKATALEKQFGSFIKTLQTNPKAILSDPRLGIDRQELALALLGEQIEEELTDPKDKEAADLKARIKAYEDKENHEKMTKQQQEEAEERQKLVSKIQSQLQDTFSKAMELSILSKDPEVAADTLREMAIHYRLAKKAGHEATPEELAQHVEQKYLKSMYSAAKSLSDEDFYNFFPKEVLDKLRRIDLQKLRGGKSAQPVQEQSWKSEPRKESKTTYIDPNDVRMAWRDQK